MVKRDRGRPAHADVLTPAEWRVLEKIRHGLSNKEIAQQQGVSLDAVKYHVANALQKLGFESRAQLRLWDGVRLDSQLAKKELLMAESINLGAIGQIARSVKSISAAVRFYGEVLGLPHLYTFGNLAFFDCGGVRLYLSEGDGQSESILYFKVADVRSAHLSLSERGIVFTHAPHMIHKHQDGTEEWMAFFKDNEDRPLGIMSQIKSS
ncbi:MAG TPA: LuxR C-terminal-related transcriptional regulator [Steroidobacteraceae bacterium]|jgi:DNA-binding CsgD family transcriptional regulator/catechol 2,3-dioxygenase-like lactoylglutathione lyase family enzyme